MSDDPVDEFTGCDFITLARAKELYPPDGKINGREIIGIYHGRREVLFANYGWPPWAEPVDYPIAAPRSSEDI